MDSSSPAPVDPSPLQPRPRPVPPEVAPASQVAAVPQAAAVSVAHGPVSVTINHGATFLVASADGSIGVDSLAQGLFCDDTRFLSDHRVRLNGLTLESLGFSQLSYRHARWLLSSARIAEGRVTVAIERTLSERRLHQDLTVRSYCRGPVSLVLDLAVATDFADLFEVRTERWQARSDLESLWRHPNQLDTQYRRNGFVRRCLMRIVPEGSGATYANGSLRFPMRLEPGGSWHVCLQVDCLATDRGRPRLARCPLRQPVVDHAERVRRRWQRTVARVAPADPRLLLAYDQAVEDFAALRLYHHDFSADVWLPAAGIPWFVAIFGRDSILASLQSLAAHPLFAIGTLQQLAGWQATVDDPVRDAEPGKICHEMRVGEWAHFGQIPHTPYYGTADATPLFLVLLAATHRWLGDAEILQPFRRAAERCLDWIDRYGDRDGDGLQEYAPRAPSGYRNQCWRDAEDGVLDEQGGLPPLPIGTCEMQAYVYGAKRDIAELFQAWGEPARAAALRTEARELRRRFLEAFWVDPPGELAFALDGNKRPVRTATSNPGHCLWMGILDPERGARVARRLLAPDLFSGWGLRTLSSDHPAYDPHDYQRGSVWPHDTLIAADGLRRYGRTQDAWRLIDGILSAATGFERARLPELFAGLTRRGSDAPIPYPRANVPQAWAAGSIFHAVRVLLGLEPDVPGGVVYLDPALPPWCPRLELSNIRVGSGRLEVVAWRTPEGGTDFETTQRGVRLEVVRGTPPWRRVSAP
ncbi:MAG TPA: glycogen debranching N-terminal domain-containing protein [Verrucomicrobiae bacterium]|nr:glycogen debranching N-terminal domain-containing protein [Verrucomicrobiae bacterium]